MMKQAKSAKWLRTVLICGVVLIVAGRAAQVKAARGRVVGLFNAQQAVEKAMPIFSAMAPDAGPLHVTAEPVAGEHGRLGVSTWNVQCTDGVGNDVGNLIIEASTGAIRAAGHPDPVRSDTGGAMPEPFAVKKAIAWLAALGSQTNEPWREAATADLNADSWWLVLRAGNRNAVVCINAVNGALRNAQIYTAAEPPQICRNATCRRKAAADDWTNAL